MWWRHHGYAVLSSIRNASGDTQSHENYYINDNLLAMIRASPHNTKLIKSQMPAAVPVTPVADNHALASDAASAVIENV